MSNIAESLNKWILIAREQPILAMFETIRHQLMDWFTARRQQDAGNTQSILVQNIANQIQTLLNVAQGGIDSTRTLQSVMKSKVMKPFKNTVSTLPYIPAVAINGSQLDIHAVTLLQSS